MVVCLYKISYAKIYNKATIYVSELILIPFSPFDIKCKMLNAEDLWKCIFTASRRVRFSYFPKVALDLSCRCGCPQYLEEFLWIMLQYSNQALCKL